MSVPRISPADLIEAKLVKPRTNLVWKRRAGNETAVLEANGSIRTRLGQFKTPSGAARALNDGKPVDGWLAWRISETNKTLAELRHQLKTTGR
jgi:hypothetical protein